MLRFPMPNDRLSDGIVVASAWYREDGIALVLILNPQSPFFTVAHYYLSDIESEESAFGPTPTRKAGDLLVLATEYNIVPAIREFEQNGGDY